MTLWLVRHARVLIEAGVCYGATDVPADPDATREAALALVNVLPQDCCVSVSPLQRCEQLAQAASWLRPDLAYKTDDRLAEMNFGSFEGQRWDSISARAFDDWTADFWQHRFGGAESVSDLMTRVSGAWDEAQAKELTLSLSQMPGRDHVWITHAGVIRATRLLAQGVREVHQAIQWPLEATGYGAWCKLAFGAAQS